MSDSSHPIRAPALQAKRDAYAASLHDSHCELEFEWKCRLYGAACYRTLDWVVGQLGKDAKHSANRRDNFQIGFLQWTTGKIGVVLKIPARTVERHLAQGRTVSGALHFEPGHYYSEHGMTRRSPPRIWAARLGVPVHWRYVETHGDACPAPAPLKHPSGTPPRQAPETRQDERPGVALNGGATATGASRGKSPAPAEPAKPVKGKRDPHALIVECWRSWQGAETAARMSGDSYAGMAPFQFEAFSTATRKGRCDTAAAAQAVFADISCLTESECKEYVKAL